MSMRISENWDFDLLKLIPQAEAILAPVADAQLVTIGSADREGRLEHPSVWNHERGMVAFFGLLDGMGRSSGVNTWKPPIYSTEQPIVTCSALEAFADAWAHGYLLCVEHEMIWDAYKFRNLLMSLMYDARGYKGYALPEQLRREKQNRVAKNLRLAVGRLEDLIERVETVTGIEIPMKTAGSGAAERSTAGSSDQSDSPHL